jgi:hypothetical protein
MHRLLIAAAATAMFAGTLHAETPAQTPGEIKFR